MWEDIKKFATIILSHLQEQRELFFYKLILINYDTSREATYARLGRLYYQAFREGKLTETYDESIGMELDMLLRAEEEIEKTRKEYEEIRAGYSSRRKAILAQGGPIWQRTGESFSHGRQRQGRMRPLKTAAAPQPKEEGQGR